MKEIYDYCLNCQPNIDMGEMGCIACLRLTLFKKLNIPEAFKVK